MFYSTKQTVFNFQWNCSVNRIVPATWFNSISWTDDGLLLGYWIKEWNDKLIPQSKVICSLYHCLIIQPSHLLRETDNSVWSDEGVMVKVDEFSGQVWVQIWI